MRVYVWEPELVSIVCARFRRRNNKLKPSEDEKNIKKKNSAFEDGMSMCTCVKIRFFSVVLCGLIFVRSSKREDGK